ncbi:hypothetical protein [Methylobacterium gregans]|uniref:hypothetical protein n=1 Tax=Methylobacterium gregans TaxID=374424 RepID=UPI001EE336CD|nr:hypothetical protein [Methylobacterium gregans]MDQ0518802.1 hypothetical protein [Methylobacterium gregans]
MIAPLPCDLRGSRRQSGLSLQAAATAALAPGKRALAASLCRMRSARRVTSDIAIESGSIKGCGSPSGLPQGVFPKPFEFIAVQRFAEGIAADRRPYKGLRDEKHRTCAALQQSLQQYAERRGQSKSMKFEIECIATECVTSCGIIGCYNGAP